jgi:hypothetical protein
MSVTNKEKSIYNSFLIASRSAKNKPFKLRQDFTNLDSTTEFLLKKLSTFFAHNSSINPTDFFIAPYKYYGADSYFELQYFTTRRAIKCYSIYCRQKETQSPDSEDAITHAKECCSFIYKFCKENNLTLQQYKTLIIGTTPAVLQHLRDHKINFYTVHGLACDRTIRQLEPGLLEFFISDFNKLLNETRIKFQQSERLKKVIREALEIIEKKLLTFISSETTITT